MPVFTDQGSSWRDLRVLPSLAPVIPRLAPEFNPPEDGHERYEVVIIGVRLEGYYTLYNYANHSRPDLLVLCYNFFLLDTD